MSDELRRIVLSQTRRGICMQYIKENPVFRREDFPMARISGAPDAKKAISRDTLFRVFAGRGEQTSPTWVRNNGGAEALRFSRSAAHSISAPVAMQALLISGGK